MKIWKEFKEFAFKGNVLDMAVGVVIGGAFGKIVTSLVNNIIMPCIVALTSGRNLNELNCEIFGTDSVLQYGQFIQSIIDFLIIAFSIFLFMRLINSARKKFEKKEEAEAAAVAAPTTEELLTEIRDLLKK